MPDKLHIAMFPWFGMGHLISFLHLSNKLASLGHRISFFSPSKSQLKLNPFNLHPNLITFISITVPHVHGLPPGAETTYDVPSSIGDLIIPAMDLTHVDVKLALQNLKPEFVLYDFAYWIPSLARPLGIKSIHYSTLGAVFVAYLFAPDKVYDPMQEPPGFPSSNIKLHAYEARMFNSIKAKVERYIICLHECDAIAFKTCREIEGCFCDYVESQFKKPVLLSGPMVPNPPNSGLDSRWANWLGMFKPGSVVYCAFGSECILNKEQMQELLLGLELTGLPFFVALKPPEGMERIDKAFPDGFGDRVEERVVVYSGWVQQQLILSHPSVGCFVTHTGYGSILEVLVNECQIVMIPHVWVQFFNARLMSRDLKVGVEVEKTDEDGWFTRGDVCKAVKSVMDDDSGVGREVKANHAGWKKLLTSEGFDDTYVERFVHGLQSSCFVLEISFLLFRILVLCKVMQKYT